MARCHIITNAADVARQAKAEGWTPVIHTITFLALPSIVSDYMDVSVRYETAGFLKARIRTDEVVMAPPENVDYSTVL